MSTKENKKNNTGLIIISSLLGLIVGGVLALASGIDLGGKDEPTYVDNGQFFSGEIVYGSKDVYKSGVIMLANHGHDVPAVNYTIEDLPSELVSNSTASINGTKVCFKIEDTGSGLVAKEIFIPSKA
ncbi:MAG: hypothetical protein KJN84_13415, partial [Bacteroidia bacterium]|nr:hypothetical protein [Bacteroidia bacterium]